jgi:hypothetical protein
VGTTRETSDDLEAGAPPGRGDYIGPARVRLVLGGRHDVLDDATHRSVAATVVLFLESLRLGPGLPAIVKEA